MTEWIDYLLIDNEADLRQRLKGATTEERNRLVAELRDVLGMAQEDIDQAVIRLLIERARPLALPTMLWHRPIDATSSIRDAAEKHLKSLGLQPTSRLLRAMQELYVRFVIERDKVFVTEGMLRRQGYCCALCGLRFYNEELERLGFESPLGNRPKDKVDPMKPHWSRADYRRPTVDHLWPVSLYGDNSTKNLVVICRGCNEGKGKYMALHQTRAFVGLPQRSELRNAGTVTLETFFAQMQRQPFCRDSGRGALEVELTVRLRDDGLPLVLDNLVTVASEDV